MNTIARVIALPDFLLHHIQHGAPLNAAEEAPSHRIGSYNSLNSVVSSINGVSNSPLNGIKVLSSAKIKFAVESFHIRT
jgi:hypothetical protein